MIRAHIVLADFAESEASGKVHLLGGAWTVTRAGAAAHAVVVFLKIPADHAGTPVAVMLRLLNKGGAVVEQPGPGGMQRLEITGQIELQEPAADWDQAIDLDAVFPVNFGTLALQAGSYTWVAEIDGKEAATADFIVRAEGA
jgi:hypothetical protein